ncbi:MAG: hypothetical protein DRN99_09065, partial [Thermoproteota archaeon]
MEHVRQPAPNVVELEWSVSGVIDLSAVEENARRVGARVERKGSAATVIYEGKGRAAAYEFTQSRVKARIHLSEPVENLEKLAENQAKIIRDLYLKAAEAPEEPEAERQASEELTSFQKLVVDTARRIWEQEGVPPSARRLARELGYASPTPIYRRAGLSLQQIYQLAGIPS